jgi:hypothetical protein
VNGERANQALLQTDDGPTLDAIDAILATAAERIDRTRKGRVWAAWVGGRPVHVSVTPVSVALSTGCNEPQDYDLLRRLAGAFAAKLGGVATEPETSKPTQPRQRTVTGLRFLATQCFLPDRAGEGIRSATEGFCERDSPAGTDAVLSRRYR